MADKVTFIAQPRTVLGKAVNRLRKTGVTPANISISGSTSLAISVGTSAFNRLYNTVGDTGLIYLTIEGEKAVRPVLIADIHSNPLTGTADHVVFKQVNLKEKLTAEVPVELVGENKVPNTVVLTVHDSIEVEALPTDLPEKFEIDITTLVEVGQMVTFNDLAYDRQKVTLMVSEEELASPVVMLQEVKEEVEATPVAETAEDGTPAEAAPAETASSEAAPTE